MISGENEQPECVSKASIRTPAKHKKFSPMLIYFSPNITAGYSINEPSPTCLNFRLNEYQYTFLKNQETRSNILKLIRLENNTANGSKKECKHSFSLKFPKLRYH